MSEKVTIGVAVGVLTLFGASCSTPQVRPQEAQRKPAQEDPYLWLEDIESPEALSWARAHNEKTTGLLKADPLYAQVEAEVRKIYLSKDRIAYPGLANGWIYNFWQDPEHVKGIWRRARVPEYQKENPAWETLIDLDRLSKDEKESWVWKGGFCAPPSYNRCLIHLSRGGKDAVVVREFDLARKAFVKDGFSLPEAKHNVNWLDENTLLVGTDFGPDSLTDSGYSRTVRIWKRGTPLAASRQIFEGQKTDVSVSGYTQFRPEGSYTIMNRELTFYSTETHLLGQDGSLRMFPLPSDAIYEGIFQGQVLAHLRGEWKPAKKTFAGGSLVSFPLSAISDSPSDLEEKIETVYAPDSRSSINSLSMGRNSILLDVLEQVKGRVVRVWRTSSGWKQEKMAFPDYGAVSTVSSDSFDDRAFFEYKSFLIPASIYFWEGPSDQDHPPRPIKSLPARFDASQMEAEQFESVSKDGTRIPYFLVHKKGLVLDGSSPTLLYGYGGFEISQAPYYLGAMGKSWLERGGVFALANIRGGGEFGPAWHNAAILEKRQTAFDDFISVAEDLIHRKVTTPAHLAIQGGSNGGLLVGAVFVQRPELFKGVICEVPLLDMLRYHKLLAGSSWMGEYGNPDDPKMAEVLSKYSPYQNVRPGIQYPKVFFMTSTKDDRVHPGHARKMVAKMEAQGHEVLYFENIEGGHGGAADLEQQVQRTTMRDIYLFEQLR